MNCSFEDVVEFDAFLDTHDGNWEATFKAFEIHRKVDTDAIADLAIDNFHEMKDHIANPIFQEKRKIEMALEAEFPETYYSKYSMVTFKETIGYNQAMTVGRAQDKAILSMLSNNKIDPKESRSKQLKKIQEETNSILAEHAISKILKL
jgi:kynurenine 3-monooxygenase